MLCNEGHRQALQARKERDKTSKRIPPTDLSEDSFASYLFLPSLPSQFFECHSSYLFDYKFRPRSLPDLTHEDYRIHFDLNQEKRQVKYQRMLKEIQWKDSDYHSLLNDIDLSISKQDPVQVYLQACRDYRIHPFNTVIEGFKTNILDLSEMSINDLDLKAICLALRIHEKIKSIRLRNNNITAQGCVYLQEALNDNSSIEEIDISKNPIKTTGIEILSLLFTNDETNILSIKKLNLSSCELIDTDGMILQKILKGGEMLEEVDLSNNQLGPIACKTIGLALSPQQRMIANPTHFFSPLENLSELRILDLSWNQIRDGDIRPICHSLKTNQSIERINLMMNGLGNQGVILLANILVNNETLIELDLSNNRIEKDGTSVFASKLEMNRRLKKLWFGNNNIGTLGSLVLLKAIDHIKSQVEYLNIENVLINDDFLDLYTQINQYIRPLEVIHGGVRGRLGPSHPTVPGFTIMNDIDLRILDTKSLHAIFQRDPFQILGRMAKEGEYDLLNALKKWDIEEHGHLTYTIYVIDFPSAVKDAGIALDKTLHIILWNYLKKIERKGSVSYLPFIQPFHQKQSK